MKVSLYNHLLPIDGQLHLFNAFRRGLHQVEESVVSALGRLERGEENWDVDLPEDFRRALIESGYVIEDDFDEHKVLLDQRELVRSDGSVVGLTIAPTIDCNFACPYCFEGSDKPQLRMSSLTMDSIIRFVRHQITNTTQALVITWFGGEPLLGLNEIGEMTTKLKEQIVDQYGLHYDASIITNGYMLTRSVAERLSNLSISQAQITLDGAAEHHDKRRFRKGGAPTFDRIIQNIVDSQDLIKIKIRVNLDSENRGSFVSLVKYLYDDLGLRDKVNVYPAMMNDDGSEKWEKAYECMSDYTTDQITLHHDAVQHGVRVLNYPNRVWVYCGASTPTFWTINPNGDLHKCWDTINDSSQAVGNVNTEYIDENKHEKWLSWSPFNYKKCHNCSVMPLCMGGCAHRAFLQGGEPECGQWKFGLQEAIAVWVQERKRAVTKSTSLN